MKKSTAFLSIVLVAIAAIVLRGEMKAGTPVAMREILTFNVDANDPPDLVTDLDGELDSFLVTNGEWLALQVEESGWEQPGFDDSHWARAQVRSPAGTSHYLNGQMPALAGALWAPVPSPEVFFRRRFHLSSISGDEILYITVDNAFDVYVNGIFVGTDDNWGSTETYDISDFLSAGENLIAIKGEDFGDGGSAGLAATIEGAMGPSTKRILWRRLGIPNLTIAGKASVQLYGPASQSLSFDPPDGLVAIEVALEGLVPVIQPGSVLVPYRILGTINSPTEEVFIGAVRAVVDYFE